MAEFLLQPLLDLLLGQHEGSDGDDKPRPDTDIREVGQTA